jgi:hypothetical protein
LRFCPLAPGLSLAPPLRAWISQISHTWPSAPSRAEGPSELPLELFMLSTKVLTTGASSRVFFVLAFSSGCRCSGGASSSGSSQSDRDVAGPSSLFPVRRSSARAGMRGGTSGASAMTGTSALLRWRHVGHWNFFSSPSRPCLFCAAR